MGNNFKWVDDMLIMVDSNGQEIRPKNPDDRLNQDQEEVKDLVDLFDEVA